MGGGKVKEYGTPEELVKNNKGFASIVKKVNAYIRATDKKITWWW